MSRSLIFGLIIALILVVFSAQNSHNVEIYFILGKPLNAHLSLVLMVTFILGVLLGYIFSYPAFRKLKKQLEEQKREMVSENTESTD